MGKKSDKTCCGPAGLDWAEQKKIYDVSMKLYPGMPGYPGDPVFTEKAFKSIAAGNSANVSEYCFGSHSGTHLDLPRHFIKDGKTLKSIPLRRFLGKVQVIEIPESVDELSAADIEKSMPLEIPRVFFKTRNSLKGLLEKKDFQKDFVALGADAAEFLKDQGIFMVGIDYLSVEKSPDKTYPVHKTFLGSEIIIVEGLVLSGIKSGIYEMVCLPMNLPEANGAPARILLME